MVSLICWRCVEYRASIPGRNLFPHCARGAVGFPEIGEFCASYRSEAGTDEAELKERMTLTGRNDGDLT